MGKTRTKTCCKTLLMGAILLSVLLAMAYPALMPGRHASAAVQEKWDVQNSGTTRRLSRVFFFDNKNGWAVGDLGLVMRTTDSGANWNAVNTGISANLKGVFFISPRDGWIVGDTGYVGRSSDSGDSWTRLETGTPTPFNDVKFQDINTGWVVGNGGLILRTINGAATWTRLVAGTDRNLRSLAIVDANNLWVTGDAGQFVRSTDGGTTWALQPAVAVSANLEGLSFSSGARGWAVGDNGNAIQTKDGGDSWVRINMPTPRNLHDVRFLDSDNGWIIGDNGTILNTRDGGQTWDVKPEVVPSRLNSLSFPDKNNGWAVGENGVILKYTKTEVFGPTKTSLTQDINDSGFVIMKLNIDKITDPVTGQTRPAKGGIASVKANLKYDTGFTIIDFRGLPPFDKSDIRVDNTAGTASLEGYVSGVEPQPPLTLGRFAVDLVGSATKDLKVNVNFTTITEARGGEIPQMDPFTLVFRKGDANGDGTVDGKDADIIAGYLAGKAKKTDLNLINAASVYPDGPDGDWITIKDAMYVAQRAAGIRNDDFRPASTFIAEQLGG